MHSDMFFWNLVLSNNEDFRLLIALVLFYCAIQLITSKGLRKITVRVILTVYEDILVDIEMCSVYFVILLFCCRVLE